MRTLWQDLRHGLRMLGRNPGFTTVAVLTLALGIGANTAIFSVVNAVLLRPLPFSEPEKLVAISGMDVRTGERGRALSYPDFEDLRKRNTSLEAAAAYDYGGFTLSGIGEPSHIQVGIASADLLAVLRATPVLGRVFSEKEDEAGNRVVLLSQHFWISHFGADRNIEGKIVKINEQIYTIVGVMPESFQFPLDTEPMDMWTTIALDRAPQADGTVMTEHRGAHFLAAIARLKPGVSLQQANAETEQIAGALQKQYPDTNLHFGLALTPQLDALVGDVKPALLMVLGAVAFLLLIACANAANLLLARATARQREMAIRASLGAGSARIVRQLLTESVLLALGGGTLGLLLAVWGTKLLVNVTSSHIPRLAGADLDLRVLGFTFGVSVFAGILFGLAPALHVVRFDLFRSLKEGGRTATDGSGHARIRGALVVSEVALAVVLLIGASLLFESLIRLSRVSPGFDPQGVATFNINLPDVRYGKPEQSAQFYRQLLEHVRALPGVTSASGVEPLPLSEDVMRTTFQVDGRPVPPSEEPRCQFRAVSLDYFQTMRIPLVAGRDFTARDDGRSLPITIINQAFASKYFPNENPIGKRVKPGISATKSTMREVVGVVGDVKHRNLWQKTDPELYVPYEQESIGSQFIVVRTQGEPTSLFPALREQVRAMDAELPIFGTRTMEDYVSSSVSQRRFTTFICSVFAVAGLVLAVIGLFGVISYGVSQRTHEIGVRLAIGAAKKDILRLVIRNGMLLTAAGIGIGLVGTLLFAKVLRSQLFGISATDPATFAAVALILGAVAFFACYLPGRRAARVDPMVALRYE